MLKDLAIVVCAVIAIVALLPSNEPEETERQSLHQSVNQGAKPVPTVTAAAPMVKATPQPVVVSRKPTRSQYQFMCDERQHCSQMKSRLEMEFFYAHCPGTKMDGDRDGRPCERWGTIDGEWKKRGTY